MIERRVITILETVRDENGEYIPCIVVEGENGYHPTNWSWGKDKNKAQKFADEYNEGLGITKEETFDIVLKSMFNT